MTTDKCSKLSYSQIKETGYASKSQAKYLYIFMYYNEPMTHRHATKRVENIFHIIFPERNGRIAELEQMGFLRKYDTVICDFTGKRVNRWIWTGRIDPLPKRTVRKQCECCEGKGFVYQEEYYEPQGQMKFI